MALCLSLDNLPAVFTIGSTGSDDFQGGAEVRFITLETKTVFDKVQSRSGGVAKQRVCDGIVQMEARSPVGQILGIRVWVFRAPEAAELHKDRNGPVQLPVVYGQHNIEQVCLSSFSWGWTGGTKIRAKREQEVKGKREKRDLETGFPG